MQREGFANKLVIPAQAGTTFSRHSRESGTMRPSFPRKREPPSRHSRESGNHPPAIPSKAGTQGPFATLWVPAFAGMTRGSVDHERKRGSREEARITTGSVDQDRKRG